MSRPKEAPKEAVMMRIVPIVGVVVTMLVILGALLISGVFDRSAVKTPASQGEPPVTTPPSTRPITSTVPPSRPHVPPDPKLSPEIAKQYPPGSFVPMKVPKVDSGILCPDGSYLPLLNGVPRAAPLKRHEWTGEVTPVVGKTIDKDGFEWWVHLDGSSTTTRFLNSYGAGGQLIPNIETVHIAPRPPGAGVVPPEAQGGTGGTSQPGNGNK